MTRLARFAILGLLLILLATGAGSAPSWYALPGAPVTSRIDDLHFLDLETGWIATGDGAIYRTDDGGASWSAQFNDAGRYFRCIRFADNLHGFAGTLTSSNVLYRTTDGGANWAPV